MTEVGEELEGTLDSKIPAPIDWEFQAGYEDH